MKRYWMTIGLTAATLMSGVVHAQSAVQWRVEDGGNGHWYQRSSQTLTWLQARDLCASRGAHLATITTSGEQGVVAGVNGGMHSWLGGFQAPGSSEPGGGWHWITGELWQYTNWLQATGEPNNVGGVNENALQFHGSSTGWNDLRESAAEQCICEWSADCNGDGVVDYGQILLDQLEDANSNGVPDCCDQGIPCEPNLLANGGFEYGPEQACGWVCLGVGSTSLPGWSVTLNSVDRQRTTPPSCQPEGWAPYDGQHSVDLNGCSIGGKIEQTVPTEPGSSYLLTIPLTLNAGWDRGDLRVHVGSETHDFTVLRTSGPIQFWSVRTVVFTASSTSTVIGLESLNREHPSQWAGPVVDAVRLVKLDENPCLADIDGDGLISAEDLALVLFAWGSRGKAAGNADLNADGIVDAVDLSLVLGSWGDCPAVQLSWATVIEVAPDPTVVTDPTLRAAILATGLPWRVRDKASLIELVLIPPGTYSMGCSPSDQGPCYPDESPVHAVTITQPFYVGRYEVTQSQWQGVMGANPSVFEGRGYPNAGSRPVDSVSWNTIQPFLAATGLRLLTEAEWEYAYRAGTSTAFHNGSNADSEAGSIAWFSSNAGGQTHPVGQKQANGFGLHDMSGNVREWVNDWYSPTYYEASPTSNPNGPSTGSGKVLRGGSIGYPASTSRSSVRLVNLPDFTNGERGFRVAKTP